MTHECNRTRTGAREARITRPVKKQCIVLRRPCAAASLQPQAGGSVHGARWRRVRWRHSLPALKFKIQQASVMWPSVRPVQGQQPWQLAQPSQADRPMSHRMKLVLVKLVPITHSFLSNVLYCGSPMPAAPRTGPTTSCTGSTLTRLVNHTATGCHGKWEDASLRNTLMRRTQPVRVQPVCTTDV